MNVLRREGYVAKVEFDARDQVLVGTIMGIDDVVGFHGSSVESLKTAFGIAIRDYRVACKALKRAPQKSHTGRVAPRIAPRTQLHAVMAADARGMSLNAWIEEAMRRAARVDLGEV